MRTPIIAGNWKMNKTNKEALDFASQLVEHINETTTEVIIAPPFTALSPLSEKLTSSTIHLAAQDVSEHPSGAYTGNISATMLTHIGCSHVIIGHSERRQYHQESNQLCEKKCQAALNENLIPIYCVGETLEERESNQTLDVIKKQLAEALNNIDINPDVFVIAYEPVWAIGTGVVATPDQAQDVHAFIRNTLTDMKGETIASKTRILYGGSVKPNNIHELITQPDIDGGLVGGACLDFDSFTQIIAKVETHYS